MAKKKSLMDIAEEIVHPKKSETVLPDTTEMQQVADTDNELSMLMRMLPKGVDANEVIDYGFYEFNHRYWIQRKGYHFEPVSNFTMKVLYLIIGVQPKRIVEITNTRKKKVVIDFQIEDLISVDKFKARVEAQGNFLFEGQSRDLGRIKNKLFTLEKPSIEITTLGQYRTKFWAWANGLFTGKDFLPADEKGMVEYEGDNYYIPVFASTQAEDDEDLRNYRKFLHRVDSSATFEEWAKLFCEVYGDNGKMAVAFGLFSLFRDIVFEKTRCSPMLFLFGQRGSGKGTLANSLLYLFGVAQDPLMLGGASTVVGFMRKLGQFFNGIVWLDEYKNDIGEKKIESLKNIWDGIGYERGVKDGTNRTQTTPVRSAAILSGQEMPNVEPALFSRTMLLEFRNGDFSNESIDRFNALRAMEQKGITHATQEILSHREFFKAGFEKSFKEISSTLRTAFAGNEVVERQIINYAVLVATVMVLEEKLKLPFTSTQLLLQSEKLIRRQTTMMKASNEVQQFFEMMHFLAASKLVTEGVDYQIWKGFLKIRLATIMPLYREYSRRQGLKPMDRGTLQNYLAASAAYSEEESKNTSHRFRLLKNPTNASVFLHQQIIKNYGVDFHELEHGDGQLPDNQEVTPKDTENTF